MKLVSLILGLLCCVAAFFKTPTARAEQLELTIGASLPLSGKLAATGDHQQKAIALALEEINQGPVRLRLIYDDNAGEPAKAVNGVTKLLSVDKVDVVFSVFSHIVLALQDIVKRSGKVFLYLAGTSKPLQGDNRIFKDWSEASDQAVVVAKAVQMGSYQTVGIVSEANEVCEDVISVFVDEGKSRAFTVVATEYFNSGETDFRSLLLRVGAKKPQVIFMCDFRDAGLVMRQYSELKLMDIPTIHVFAPFVPQSDTPEVRAIYEKNKARTTWVNFVEASLSEKQKAFAEKFRTRYGFDPRFEAVLTYDDMFFFAAAAKDCLTPALDQECLTKNFKSLSHEGVAGRLAFGESRSSHRQTTLIELRDGRWKDVSLETLP